MEGDLGPVAGGAPDRRTGERAAVGPHPRRAAGQDLDLGLADRDPQLRAAQLLGDRQGIPERGRGSGTPRPRGDRGRLARPQVEGQQRGQGAAAQGAEESSAPQAWLRLEASRPWLAARQHVDRAVHPGVDRAHEVDPRRAGRGVDVDRLFDRGARFVAGEPGVALLWSGCRACSSRRDRLRPGCLSAGRCL